jgi:hypothetical protein
MRQLQSPTPMLAWFQLAPILMSMSMSMMKVVEPMTNRSASCLWIVSTGLPLRSAYNQRIPAHTMIESINGVSSTATGSRIHTYSCSRERRWMWCIQDAMLARDDGSLGSCILAPQKKHYTIELLAHQSDDAIGELMPTNIRMRSGVARSNCQCSIEQ